MLGRAAKARVGRVDVQLEAVENIARDHSPLKEMNVIKRLRDRRGIIKILQRRLAVLPREGIDHMHRRARGPEMHPVPGQLQVMLFVPTVQGDPPRRLGQHVLDQCAGIPKPPVIAQDRARIGHDLDARLRRIR